MFSLKDQLPKGEKASRSHIEALRAMTGNKERQDLFDHLYGCLSILDAKSSSLLSFNSIIIAVFAIFMTSALARVEWITITVGMASILVSSLLLLSVVWIHWSTTDHLKDLKEHELILLNVRRSRTIKYRLAWYFAVVALGALTGFFLLRLIKSVF